MLLSYQHYSSSFVIRLASLVMKTEISYFHHLLRIKAGDHGFVTRSKSVNSDHHSQHGVVNSVSSTISKIMGIFSRFHRVPPFFVDALCGGILNVYFHQNLRVQYHAMPQSIWNIIYSENKRILRDDNALGTDSPIQRTQSELYDAAAERRANREYLKKCMMIGYNDYVRSVHAFLVRHIFGEEFG